MTVCLAALCAVEDAQDGTAVVVASDRMVTLGGFIEFEHAVPKMAQSSPCGIVMIAGDTLVGTSLARDVGATFDGKAPRVADIAEALAQGYTGVRQRRVQQQILSPRGLDFNTFYGAHASLNPNVTMMIDNAMATFNLGVELLLAGVDSGRGHIYSVTNPGDTHQHDVIGYTAIGSGALHALQALIGFGHHSKAELKETVFRVYAAKRRAEVAPGVGHDTDLAIVRSAGIERLTADQLKQLETVYDSFQNSTQQALTDQLKGLNLDAEGTES